jgi:tetratricopeptide (TPR) repeat protein
VKNAVVPRFLLLAVLGLGGVAAAAAQPSTTEAAHQQADAFLSQARSSLAAGARSEAADFLASALQLAPDYSEALYLRARLELGQRSAVRAAIDDLRAALANGSWTTTDPSVAGQDLADLLLRTGGLTEARTLLTRLALHDPSNARTSLLLARLYNRAGEQAALRRTLADAVLKFPLEDDFFLLLSGLLEKDGNRAEARRVIATQLRVHADSLPLLLRAAELAAGAGARIAAVEAYTARGGKDPLASVVALEAGARNPQKYLSQFIDNGGLSREDLVERVSRALQGSRSLTSSLQSALSRYSGNRDLDPQGDGHYQERWTFQDGQLISWVRDTHEDGQPELAARYSGGSPVSLTMRTAGDTLLTLSYSTYPSIDSVNVPASPENPARTYMIVPYSLKFPFLAGRVPAAAGFAPRALRNPGTFPLSGVLRSSYVEEEYAADGTLVRRIDLLRGQRVFMEEKLQGTGPFDHKVWYRNGQPVRGARDLDGSGRFAVQETWRDGRLAAIAVDTNGDGKVDYREQYLPTPMKSWDYDEDGRVDSREYPAGPSTIVRDFSTGLNGVFDVSFTWKNGDLVRVVRRGHALSVTTDPARGVVWIGPAAPASVAFNAGEPEGYRSIAGKEYLVFRHEGVTYVEELP